jgi:hypothetical protein
MILVATIIHERKRYAFDHICRWLTKADLPDCKAVVKVHGGEYGAPGEIKQQREYLRRLAWETGASHLCFVGVDTIPPLDAVPRLLAHNVPVVSGLYFGRHNAENGSPDVAVCGVHSDPLFNKREHIEKLYTLQLVDWVGMDAILLARPAFESICWLDYEVADDDYPACQQLQSKGFKIYLDPTVVCRHYSTETVWS